MCDNAIVIGHHRSNSRFVKITLPVKNLEKFRLELVYSPKVIEIIKKNSEENFIEYTKEYVEYLILIIPEWIEENHKIVKTY